MRRGHSSHVTLIDLLALCFASLWLNPLTIAVFLFFFPQLVLYLLGNGTAWKTFVKYLRVIVEDNNAVEWCVICLLSAAIIAQLLASKKKQLMFVSLKFFVFNYECCSNIRLYTLITCRNMWTKKYNKSFTYVIQHPIAAGNYQNS